MQRCEILPLGSATWSRASHARLTSCTRTNQHALQQDLGTLGLSPLHSGSIAMDNGSHPRNEHVSTDGAQKGHGRLLHSGGGPNMEVVSEARYVQSQPDVFLPLGGQQGLLLSVGGELVSEKVETRSLT